MESQPGDLRPGVGDEDEEAWGESDATSSCTGKRLAMQTFSFSADKEQKPVIFFSQQDCFYNKASAHYNNRMYKRKLLEALAVQLDTDCEHQFRCPQKRIIK